MLFHCWGLLQPRSRQLVTGTLNKLLAVRHPSGNLPIIFGDAGDQH
eukprot:gene54946-51500_t